MTAIRHDANEISAADQNVSMNIRLALTLLGKKGTYISNQLDMHRAVWSTRMTNDTRWTLAEVVDVAHILGVPLDVLVKDPNEAKDDLFGMVRTGSFRTLRVVQGSG